MTEVDTSAMAEQIGSMLRMMPDEALFELCEKAEEVLKERGRLPADFGE